MPRPDISLVVPVFNEEGSIDPFFQRVAPILKSVTDNYEFVFVNDGSRDQTLAELKAWLDKEPVRIVDFSRNFGKEAALTAGLDAATGSAVIPMDVDLQDPPELIPEMVAKWREGYDMVLAIRRSRERESWLKRCTASCFYRLMGRLSTVPIPFNAGDFRLLDRRVTETLKLFPERSRFMKGIFASLGFKQTTLAYDRDPRLVGNSKWNYWRLWNFALEGMTSFSSLPLRVWSYIGFFLAFLAMLYALIVVGRTLLFGVDVPGYASMLVSLLFLGGLQLISIGVLGEYVARIFIEVKHRPIYIVRERIGFDDSED